MARNNQRGSRNNNPEGRNQFSSSWRDAARERPLAAAATAAAAVGAGVFLWSRRNQISEQISNLSDQVGEWAGNMQSGSSQSGSSGDFEYSDGRSDFSAAAATTGSGGGKASRGKGGEGRQDSGGAAGSTDSMSSAAEGASSGGTTAGDRAF